MPLSARVEEGVTLVELEVGDVKRSYAAGVAQGRRADDAGGVAHRKADGSTHCIGGAQGSGGDWGGGGTGAVFFGIHTLSLNVPTTPQPVQSMTQTNNT